MPALTGPQPAPPPPLKWAGGKRWLLPVLRGLWKGHEDRRLVEPFVGGMAVALGLQPARALLNDSNPHLINFYRWLQAGLTVDQTFANDSDLYYRHRERFNELVRGEGAASAEAAQLFYYLNRTGFNGLCRFNGKGEFNVPFGSYSRINYETDFGPWRAALRDWTFTSGDFARLQLQGDDFVYADPPYDVQFTSYSAGGFDWNDQLRLAEWLAASGVPTVVSNQATERVIDLYASLGFAIETVEAPRRISSNGDRTPALEMIATLDL